MDSHFDTLEFDPFIQPNLIQPLETRDISSSLISDLYREEQLTQDEYIVLDFIGTIKEKKSGDVIMSFQGIKRLVSLHQAKLTKAINRLCSKDMLVKVEGGYTLTSMGDEVFHRLTHLFGRPSKSFQKELYSFVTKGSVQGPILTYDQLEQISNGLIGKWFDKYRFTTKISKENSFEFNWLSTNGSISVTLQVGPRNELTISTSASIYSVVQNESQLLINSISQMLESLIDAPIIFLSHQIFQNTHKISQEAEYAKFNFAG